MDQAPRVFLSYSHDSEAHREQVLALSERLRRDGIDAILDCYVNGSPPEGWPRWMLNRLDDADRVLLICTPSYYRRFRGQEAPGRASGVDWEGAVITQALYDARSATTRFIPVLLSAAHAVAIPEPLRAQTYYCLTSEDAYQALYDALLGQSGVRPAALGTPRHAPRRQTEPQTFADIRSTPATATPTRAAVSIWLEKLDYLREQQAICSDPAQKFTLRKLIEEAEAKLRELD